MPVERAFEANEGATKQKKTNEEVARAKQSKPIASVPLISTSVVPTVDAISVDQNRSFKNFTTCQSVDASSDDIEKMRKSRYEIPDNQLSRKAVNILAGKKEVEMYEFYGADDDHTECDDRKLVPKVDPSGDRTDSPENV